MTTDRQPNMNTPLVTITFTTDDAQRTGTGPRVIRRWYHVPRAGDLVSLEVPAGGDPLDVPAEPETELSDVLVLGFLVGTVRYVEWNDDGVVVVLK